MKSFSIARCLLWLGFIWRTKRVKLGYLCLLTALILAAVFTQDILSKNGMTQKMSTNIQSIYHFIGLLVFGILCAYELFKGWISDREAIYKNLLPISNAEIMVTMLLLLVLVIPTIFTLVFVMVDLPLIYFANVYLDQNESIFMLESTWRLQPQYFYQICMAIFVFWMLSVRKYSFFISVLFTIGVVILVITTFGISYKMFLPDMWSMTTDGWVLIADGKEVAKITSQIMSQEFTVAIMHLPIIGIHLANYFRFREIQVRNGHEIF